MNPSPAFLASRRSDVRSTAPWSPFAYIARQLDSTVAELGRRAELRDGARVLDLGCADLHYRRLLPDHVDYRGADLVGNPWADYELSPDGTVPVPDATFSLVLSTQVLEHVPDPRRYLRECWRLLEPGGTLLLTTHGIMYYHPDPEDYWRWTGEGLAKIIREAGFDIEEIRGLMGLVAAALQLLQDGSLRWVPRPVRRPYIVVMQALMALTDRRYSEPSRLANALVYAVRAVKPA